MDKLEHYKDQLQFRRKKMECIKKLGDGWRAGPRGGVSINRGKAFRRVSFGGCAAHSVFKFSDEREFEWLEIQLSSCPATYRRHLVDTRKDAEAFLGSADTVVTGSSITPSELVWNRYGNIARLDGHPDSMEIVFRIYSMKPEVRGFDLLFGRTWNEVYGEEYGYEDVDNG